MFDGKQQFFPLSKSEEGIYISSLSNGDAYNLTQIVNLRKDVNKEIVKKALNQVIKAHPYLLIELPAK